MYSENSQIRPSNCRLLKEVNGSCAPSDEETEKIYSFGPPFSTWTVQRRESRRDGFLVSRTCLRASSTVSG